jgi:hypothetical protein
LLAGLARAGKRYMIAALLGDDTEPPLDQRQVLPVLTEQHRGQTVVVESQHDLGRAYLTSRVAIVRTACAHSGSLRYKACSVVGAVR